MDTFYLLATSTFATTTGLDPAALMSYATSSVMNAYIGFVLSFLENNTQHVIAYGMIATCLLVALSAWRIWRF